MRYTDNHAQEPWGTPSSVSSSHPPGNQLERKGTSHPLEGRAPRCCDWMRSTLGKHRALRCALQGREEHKTDSYPQAAPNLVYKTTHMMKTRFTMSAN